MATASSRCFPRVKLRGTLRRQNSLSLPWEKLSDEKFGGFSVGEQGRMQRAEKDADVPQRPPPPPPRHRVLVGGAAGGEGSRAGPGVLRAAASGGRAYPANAAVPGSSAPVETGDFRFNKTNKQEINWKRARCRSGGSAPSSPASHRVSRPAAGRPPNWDLCHSI